MPKQFSECVKSGGRIRTVKGKKFGLAEGQYKHVCFKNGKAEMGETKTKQKGA